ncbi:MAG: ABC transporter substrate-binding protein [Croceibacterium sp.]
MAGCSGRGAGSLRVAVIDNGADLFAAGNRLSPGAQLIRAATRSGLVALDEKGDVVPALADQWTVTDDGLSYIFRLREGKWPDGREMTAQSVRSTLGDAIRGLRGTSLGLDLASIAQIRAMAGQVIEIRLSRPAPSLLQVLAQPELALQRGAPGKTGDTGPMLLERRGIAAVLQLKRPADRGLPEEADWGRYVRPVELTATSPARAIDLFGQDAVDVVLGGTLAWLPLAPSGPLSRGTVQLDPAVGLFGLQVRTGGGFLGEVRNREAIAMALDRAALIAPFNIGGWAPATRIVPPQLPGSREAGTQRWAGQPIDALRAAAARRVAGWRAAHGGAPVRLTLALGDGPGNRALMRELTSQLAGIGIVLEAVPEAAPADLVPVDRVARYAAPQWFLDQFNCALRQGLCDPAADALVAEAAAAPDPASRAAKLAAADAHLTEANLYIPFGSPIRFSLVRSNVTGFAPNAWAFHPLPPLAAIPK